MNTLETPSPIRVLSFLEHNIAEKKQRDFIKKTELRLKYS